MTSPPYDTICTRPPVRMFTAPNPGPKTLSGTHTYVIGQDHAFVLDPGPAISSYQEMIARASAALNVEGILLTHGHPDHAPGASTLHDLFDAPVWASPRMPEEVRRSLGVERVYAEEQQFQVDGDVLQVIPSPGHTFDHVALWLSEARLLFAGDTILGKGTTLIAPPEGDMREYMTTLDRLRSLEPRLIAPGHGPLIHDPTAKFEEYIQHRRQREDQALHALESGPASLDALVQRIYTDVDPRLLGLAAGSLLAQLQKLESEGRVWSRDGRYCLAETGSDRPGSSERR